MLRRRLAVCCLALLLALGNAAAVQVVAWTGMIAARSGDAGIVAAVVSTLSGERPCGLCRAAALIDERGPADRGAKLLAAMKQIDAPAVRALLALPPAALVGGLPALPSPGRPARDGHAPEPPPPRC